MQAALAYSFLKEIYYRETITTLNHELLQISFISFYATRIINPFLNSRISANHDKVQGLSANMVKS